MLVAELEGVPLELLVLALLIEVGVGLSEPVGLEDLLDELALHLFELLGG